MRSFTTWFDWSYPKMSLELLDEVLLKRELWMVEAAFAFWKHVSNRKLALELLFDDLEVRIEHIHLASAFERWIDFVLQLETTASDASQPTSLPDLTEDSVDMSNQNASVCEPWTPGSTIHNDWSWSQQLELLQSRRAEQDWLDDQPAAKSLVTPSAFAGLVDDMRGTRLKHQAKMHKMRSEPVSYTHLTLPTILLV